MATDLHANRQDLNCRDRPSTDVLNVNVGPCLFANFDTNPNQRIFDSETGYMMTGLKCRHLLHPHQSIKDSSVDVIDVSSQPICELKADVDPIK